MISDLLEQLKALINERASAQVLRLHLQMVREECQALQAQNAELQSKQQQLRAQLAQAKQRLQAYEHDNPHGHRCHSCGSGQLRLAGRQLAKLGGEFGITDDVMLCKACGATSVCAVPHPR